MWLMKLLLPLVSPSLERYPLPTHNSSSFIFGKFPSFSLYELLEKQLIAWFLVEFLE
jgi:hypothetical protein